MNYRKKMERRREVVAAGLAVCEKVKAEGRDLSDAERLTLDAGIKEVEALDAEIKATDADEAKFAVLNGAGRAKSGSGKQFLRIKSSSAEVRRALGVEGGRVNVKALVTDSSSLPVTFDDGIVEQGRPASTLLDVIPSAEVEGENYAYLAQTLRTNSAAPVATGGLKPTSPMGLEKRDGKLKVIAHVSDPLDRFMLEDVSNLEQFVVDELGAGVIDALIGQLLVGDGTGENLTGLAAVSGTLVQAFKVDTITSIRAAFTTLETSGRVPAAVVMNAAEWEAIETARTTTNGFQMSPIAGPVDAVARRLYGVPVAVVPQMPANVAWVLSDGAAEIKTDGKGIRVDFGMVGDSFARNQIIGRGEGRFDLAVKRPSGIVKVSLSA